MRRKVALPLALALAFAPAAAPRLRGEEESTLAKRKREALEKGCAWLKGKQNAEGEWDYADGPFRLGAVSGKLIQGVTALSAFALLKSGVPPKDPAIAKAFQAIHKRPLEHTYAVGCVLLAIEAKANWEPNELTSEKTPGKTQSNPEKDQKPKKPDPADLDLARRCVEWLERGQKKRVWRYQGEPDEDASNPQYALLGLDAAERLGLPVTKTVYEKAAEYFIATQEKEGPEVKPFPVTGADVSFAELKKVEKELRDRIRKIAAGFKGKKPGEVDGSGRTEEDQRRLAEDEAAKKVSKTVEKQTAKLDKMFARGWKYGTKGGEAWTGYTTGSMTTSALACMFICKAHLEGTEKYERELKAPLNKALRDGAAWLAKNYTVTANPGNTLHHYYYMYGLERAGILGLVLTFAEHDWYTDGSLMFLDAQGPDGSWFSPNASTVGPVCDTCFALLFLARGTTPLVKLPERTATGAGVGKGAEPPPPKK